MKYAVAIALLSVTFASGAIADNFGSGANFFNIDFVSIGNPGNAADTTGLPNPAGSVPYTFNIGKYEVNRDSIKKANALGGLGIALTDMTDFGAPAANGPNYPATGISWNAAARFVNWLNTSSGSSPAYKFATQPSDVGYSPNDDIQLWAPGDPGYNPQNLYRNSLARYFLPSVDEWYKAAYYDPANDVYYNYPTGSDAQPTAVVSGTAPGTAVFLQSLPLNNGPAEVTLAGGLSPYGTVGQGGNVSEWDETDEDLVNDMSLPARRGARGGFWRFTFNHMRAEGRDIGDAEIGIVAIGFRVASIAVPEPATPILLAIGIVSVAARRRRPTSPGIASKEHRSAAR